MHREDSAEIDDARFAMSFAGAAQEYERGRPGYPSSALDALSEVLDLRPSSVVVDLAAGTGKLARDLAPRYDR